MNINSVPSYSNNISLQNRKNIGFGNVLAVKISDPFEHVAIESVLYRANPNIKSLFIDSKGGSAISVFASGEDAKWLNKYTVKLAKAIKHIKNAIGYGQSDIYSMMNATESLRKEFFDKNIDKYISLEKVLPSNEVLKAIENKKLDFDTLEIAA